MTRRLGTILALLAVLLFPLPSGAKNTTQLILATQTVSTAGGPVSVNITNPNNRKGYLVFRTTAKVASASLVVDISNRSGAESFIFCSSLAVTTESLRVVFMDSALVSAGGAVTKVCPFPASRDLTFTFTVTGAGASFDVGARMEWVTE